MVRKTPKRTKIYIFALIILCVLVITVGVYLYYYSLLQKPLYGTSFSGLKLGNGGTSFTVTDGRVKVANREESFLPRDVQVLRLANFSLLEAEDPLFSGPGIDSKQFTDSVSELTSKQNTFLSSMGLSQEIAPTEFLTSVSRVVEMSEVFKTNRSYRNAVNLIDSEETAIQKYGNNLKVLKSKIPQGTGGKTGVTLENLGSSTDTQTIISDINLMEKNQQALLGEVKKQKDILYGFSPYIPGKQVVERFSASQPHSSQLLSTEELNLNNGSVTRFAGPYLINTSCFGGMNQNRYFYATYRLVDGIEEMIPKLADDNYFTKLSPGSPPEAKYISEGYTYHLANEGNTYRCNDLEYQARILTIENYIKAYKNSLIFDTQGQSELSRMLGNDFANKLSGYSALESKFISGKNIGDKELGDLTAAYLDTYQHLKALSSTDSGKAKLQSELLERYLFLSRRGSSLNQIFADDLFFHNLNERFQNGILMPSQSFLDSVYAMRSAYSISYLNFSPSVWRLTEKPKYLFFNPESANSKTNIYATYLELLQKYSKAEILSWYKISENELIGANN